MTSMDFVDPVAYELAQERAGSLGRLGNQLEAGLRRLRELDASPPAPHHAARRDELLWELAESLMFLLVAREACGLRSSEHVLRYYRVPREVTARLGVHRRPQGERESSPT